MRNRLLKLVLKKRVLLTAATAALMLSLISLSEISVKWVLYSLLERGGSYWTKETTESLQLPWLTHALKDTETVPSSTIEEWREIEDGMEYTTVTAKIEDETMDVIHLLRVDSKKRKLTVHVEPGAYRDADEWADALKAKVIINGSYYADGGYPLTPVKSFNGEFGPSKYDSQHGTFVVNGTGAAEVTDNLNIDWRDKFQKAEHAMVSYPLLLSSNGEVRAGGHDDWLANRSFVANDVEGQIIIGNTERAYFSIRRLGRFLKTLPIGIKNALNLDGGPVAALAIRTGGLSKTIYRKHELITKNGEIFYLRPGYKEKKWSMPIVLAVH